jgi:hypothetical protein
MVWAAAALLAAAGAARASDPVGIYALIDKVVLEPKEDKPERAQVWGVFRFAVKNAGDEYTAPTAGYLYFKLAPDKEEATRREWADLKKVAGTGQVVAFASRYGEKGTPHKASEKPDKTDAYPVAGGMHKIANGGDIAKDLRSIALPAKPEDGGEVAAGSVSLSAKPIADKDRKNVKYVFEISSGGDKETSDAQEAGKDGVEWKPKLAVKAGKEYTWRVWAVSGDWKGPAVTATFKGKSGS